jgi:hypothetical protein
MARAARTRHRRSVPFTQPARPPMNSNETPQDRPEPQQANGTHTERRYARRIDCTARPRPAEPAASSTEPAPPRDDAHP